MATFVTFTEEQLAEINERIVEELGEDCPIRIECHEDGDHDGEHDGGGGRIDLWEIIMDVAGEDFSGDPCDLTEEQRAEIERRVREETGDDGFEFRLPPCDGTGGGGNDGGRRYPRP